MIAYISGTLRKKNEASCIVTTSGGVGYEIYLPLSVIASLPEENEDISLFIQTVVREDALDLYGFGTWEERETFSLLLSIHKLGPKTALAVLSTYDPQRLQKIVAEENVKALVRVPGIGEKTAKRILWDLKDRYKKVFAASYAAAKGVPSAAESTVFEDVLAAMKNLGYKDDEIIPLVNTVLQNEPDLDVEGGVRAVLKIMAAKRSA